MRRRLGEAGRVDNYWITGRKSPSAFDSEAVGTLSKAFNHEGHGLEASPIEEIMIFYLR